MSSTPIMPTQKSAECERLWITTSEAYLRRAMLLSAIKTQ